MPLLATHEEFRSVLGNLFALKISILLAVIFLCVLAHRFFCRVLCPLGAIYGLMNKFSFCQLNYSADRCVGCGRCKKICPLELDPTKDFSSAECVRCGRCKKICPLELNPTKDFSSAECVRCGRCKKICPLELNPTKDFSFTECVRCGRCEKICPTGALTQSIIAPPKTSSPS